LSWQKDPGVPRQTMYGFEKCTEIGKAYHFKRPLLANGEIDSNAMQRMATAQTAYFNRKGWGYNSYGSNSLYMVITRVS
jgi:hypothetical protein